MGKTSKRLLNVSIFIGPIILASSVGLIWFDSQRANSRRSALELKIGSTDKLIGPPTTKPFFVDKGSRQILDLICSREDVKGATLMQLYGAEYSPSTQCGKPAPTTNFNPPREAIADCIVSGKNSLLCPVIPSSDTIGIAKVSLHDDEDIETLRALVHAFAVSLTKSN